MASKKLKKALIAGLGAAALSKIGQANQMKTFLAEEGGDRAKVNYITKKAKPIKKTFMGNVKDATKKVVRENINLGRGPAIKKTDTIADLGKGDAFSYFDMNTGGSVPKMVKARGGKLVNLKPTKMS